MAGANIEVEEPPEIPGVERLREQTRSNIAYIALGSFFFLLGVIVIVGWLALGLAADDVLKILTATAGVLGGIVGAIVGFYFRQES